MARQRLGADAGGEVEYYLVVLGALALAAILYWFIARRSAASRKPELPGVPVGSEPVEVSSAADLIPDILDGEEDLPPFDKESSERAGKLALLGDLAAGIAHEINNPVAIMVEEAGWIEDLLEEKEFRDSPNLEELRRALRQIRTQGTRCKEIIQNLLSFGRKAGIKVADVQVNDLIMDVVRAYEKRTKAGAIVIETRLADGLPTCRLSPSEMQQILSNLINNAIDALSNREGRIEIATRLQQTDVIIDVVDNGQGIPPEILERIFDPFFTTKPVGKGTGLGLSICYGLVEKMGGAITVESEAGKGTAFHVRIPPAGAEQRPHPSAVPADRRAAGETTESGTPLLPVSPTVVLIVDDEEAFVEALRRRLTRRSLEVDTAFSGTEALEKLRHKRDIDVVVLDVKMAGMDGIETLREIKAARPLVEVILLSAHTTVEAAIEGIKLGAFDYLLKPCDMTQLVDQIARAKQRKNRQEQKIMEARIKEITARRI